MGLYWICLVRLSFCDSVTLLDEKFRHTFLRNCDAYKVETWYMCTPGQWLDVSCIPESMRPRRLRLGAHMNGGWMYHVYRNQAAASYLSLYSFMFLSPIFKH